MGTNFWGQYVEFFGHNGIRFIDGTIVAKLAADPTSTAAEGQESSLGMFGGNLYVKTDSGSSTNWKLLADDAALQAHINSTTAHGADDITYDNSTSGLTATNSQAAIDEVEGRLDTAETNIGNNTTNLSNHIASTTAHGADDITYDNSTSGLTATNSQAAIDEVEGRLDTEEATGLQDIYARSTDGDIELNSTQGKIVFKDNSTPISGNLLEVSNNAETTQYLEVSADRTVVTDRDGRHVLRKDVDILHIEDFKENDPTGLISVTGSWTLANETGASKIDGFQSASLTQVAGSLGATAEITGVVLNERSLGLLMEFLADFKYSGNNNDIMLQVLESSDNISYSVLESLSLSSAINTKLAKLDHRFNSGSTHTGIRLTVSTENIGEVLLMTNIRWQYSPDPGTDVVFDGSSEDGWQSYNPVTQGIGTPTNVEARWRRNGSVMDVMASLDAGTVSAAEFQLGLPVGNIIANAITQYKVVGDFGRGAATGAVNKMIIATGGNSYVNIGNQVGGAETPIGGSSVVGSGEGMMISFSVEIEGWTDNVIRSVPVTDFVTNDFSCKIQNNGAASKLSEKFTGFFGVPSRLSVGTVRVPIVPTLTVAPTATADVFGNLNRVATVVTTTTTYVDIETRSTSGTLLDENFSLFVELQDPDSKAAQSHFISNVPLSSSTIHEYTGTALNLSLSDAYWTGKLKNGRKLMAFDIKVGQDIGAVTIANLPTNLEIFGKGSVNAGVFIVGEWYQLQLANHAFCTYTQSTGAVTTVVNGETIRDGASLEIFFLE